MASRRGSKRRLSNIEEVPYLDAENPKNWTKEKLIAEIANIGIKVPASLKVKALVQIFNDNKKTLDSGEDASIVPQRNIIREIEAAASNIQSAHNQTVQTEATVSNSMSNNCVTQPFLSGRQTFNGVITSQQNVSQPINIASMDYSNLLAQQGVPAEKYRNVEVVSTQLRNQIIAGKDVNLALLLIPNNESTAEYRRVDFDGVEYVLKPGDPRLSRSLTLGEFIMAFSRYKNIVCEALPHRRTELDHYERDIVEMANQFGGTRFYDYHKAFSAKAAALLHQQHIKVDWSIRDNNLFCTIFAGMKANVCGLCSSVNHTTEFCPLLVNPNFKKGQNQAYAGHTHTNSTYNGTNASKKQSKTVINFQGIPLCNNYNERTCTRQVCKFLHLCYDCFSPHPKNQCKGKPKEKTDTLSKPGEKKGSDKSEKSSQ